MKLINKIKTFKYELFVFFITFFSRLPSLGRDFFNNDVFLWKERGYAFGEAFFSLNFSGTLVTYHPGVPLTWILVFGIKIFSLFDKIYYKGTLSEYELVLVTNTFQKLSVIFFTSMLLVLLFMLLKKLFTAKVSLVAILLLFFEPFFFYLGKAIHTDVLLTLFISLSLFSFFYSFENTKKVFKNIYVLYAGLSLGLAILTKSSALFLFPFFIIWTFIEYLLIKNKNALKILFFTFLVAILTFVLVWPAMWVTPGEALSAYFGQGVETTALKEGHMHLWFGVETLDPGFWFYPLMLIGKFAPVFIFIFLYGIYAYLKDSLILIKLKNIFTKSNKVILSRKDFFGIYVYGFSLGFLIMITLVSKKIDRYMLPIIFPVLLIGVYYLFKNLKKRLLTILLFVFFFINISVLILLHPNYNAYYSPLVGGLGYGKNILEPTWIVGCDKVADKFNAIVNNKDDSVLTVAFADYVSLKPFSKGFNIVNIRRESERDTADYFILPVYSKERNAYYKSKYYLERDYDLDVYIGPVLYYEVYKVEGKK